ncbi:MAG: glycosyltransferase [Chloroflexi bacterium]|nr:glycosyltransferase [Chloroflexota bacterium]
MNGDDTRKRILFLTPQLPYPPEQGTAIRNYNIIANVAQRHEIHLLSFVSSPAALKAAAPLHSLCCTLESVPAPKRTIWQRLSLLATPWPDIAHRLASPLFSERLAMMLSTHDFDVLQVEGLEMAPYGYQALARRQNHRPLLVFDAHNAEYLLQHRIAKIDWHTAWRWPGALYSTVQWLKLRRYEGDFCHRVDAVVAVSDADAQALARLVPGLKPLVLPNGVDIAYYQAPDIVPAALGPEALVFTGKMDFRPNVDAVLWFANEVLPLIRERAPQARFYIVGKNPHARLDVLRERPEVVVTGYVEDVRPYIAAAAVYVVPMRTGGGTRLKVLEAMAMGKAIVSTTLGCEGVYLQNGYEALLADTPRDFADAVLALLANGPRRAELGQAAAFFVAEHYDWRRLVPRLEQVYEGDP